MSSPNWENKTIWTGDNLPIMRGMNSRSVDLIYLDPPFNSKANYAAPIGSKAAGAEFKDTWTLSDIDVTWINLIEEKHPQLHRVLLAAMAKSDKSYLVYMAVRLLEMYRLLKDAGSIYLHCDPTMSHYLKLVMDAIFGRRQFRNEVVWCYSGPSNTKKQFPRKHDNILFYSKGEKWTFNTDKVRINYSDAFLKRRKYTEGVSGITGGYSEGRTVKEITHEYAKGKLVEDYWTDIKGGGHISKRELVGYPTQKPLALLRRIIKASSNHNDVVLDPFCGCATTCVAAEYEQRSWVGIDISEKAKDLVIHRIKEAQGIKGLQDSLYKGIKHRIDIPKRTDLGKLLRYNCRENKEKLYGEQEGNCAGCKGHFEMRNLTIDHIIDKNSGGTDHIENLQLLCGNCNSVKGNRGMEYLMAKLQMR